MKIAAIDEWHDDSIIHTLLNTGKVKHTALLSWSSLHGYHASSFIIKHNRVF